MKKLSLQTWINKFKLVLVRFPFALLFVIGFSVLCFLEINKSKIDIHQSLWAFFVLGFLLNIPVTLYLEEFKKFVYRYALNILPTFLLAVYCFTLPEKLLMYHIYQLIALGIVFVLSAFFVSFLKKNNEIPFWNFSRDSIIQLIISFFFSSVLFGGISLALLSLEKLFNVHIDSTVYKNLGVVCFVIFAPFYFLANLPDEYEKRKQYISFDSILKIFGLYILLPILTVYTLILYVYLLQIIIKWELPNGWVSTLVSVLGLGGFLFMMIVHPLHLKKENKVVDFFSKYFPLLLFPLLILMSVGIFRRLGDYGLTINRCYVLILNIWLIGISIYLFLSKARQIKWIVVTFATVAFVTSVGPWSVFSITKNSLTTQLEKQLTEAHLLKDGKVMLEQNQLQSVDTLTQMKTAETVQYLVRNFGSESINQYFNISLKNKSAFDILELMKMNIVSDVNHNFHLHSKNDSCIYNTNSYKTFVVLNAFENEKNFEKKKNLCENSELKVDLFKGQLIVTNKLKNNATFNIDLKSKIKLLLIEMKVSGKDIVTTDKMTINGPDFKLIMTIIDGENHEPGDKIILTNFNAYLFLQLEK